MITTTPAGRHRLRVLARVLLPGGLAAAVVGLSAAPALAATSLSVTDGSGSVVGQTITSDTTVQVSASDTATDPTGLSHSRTLNLTVTDPSGGQHALAASKTVRSNANGSISGTLDTACPSWSSSPCIQAMNGDYTITFSNGTSTRTATVTLRVPPGPVAGFAATTSGTVATFTWTPVSAPDLIGYDIRDGDSDVTPGDLDPAAVCDSSGCAVSVDFGPSVRGTSHDFAIYALRHTSPGSSSAVPSAEPGTAQASFGSAPSPGTSGGAGGDGPTGPGSAGTGTHAGSGSTGGGSRSGVPTGKHPSAELRAYLPTTAAGAAPSLPPLTTEVKPLPQGTYQPTLAYPDQVQRDKVSWPTANSSGAGDEVSRLLDLQGLWKALAGAAVLLLVAAHLRAWVSAPIRAD